MKKKVLASLICVGAALGLASCKIDPTPTPTPTPTPVVPTPTPTPEPSPTPEVVKFTITFNTMGGDALESIEVDGYKTVASLPTPTKTGFAFVAWYRDEALTDQFEYNRTYVDRNVTLYAKWETARYVVKEFYSTGEEILPYKVNHGVTLGIPVKVGYKFVGFFLDEEYTIPYENTGVTSNLTVYAKFEALPSYDVTYVINGHGEQPEALTDVYKLPSELPVLEEEGYRFLGWYTDEELTVEAEANVDVTADVTLYAKWELITYTVTYQNNGLGVKPEDLKVAELPDELPELSADEYEFLGWFYDSEFTDPAKAGDKLAENVTLYAKWIESTYSVTYDVNEVGEAPAGEVDVKALPSTLPTLTADGYVFLGWYIDEELIVEATPGAKITEDTVLYAKWIKDTVVEQTASIMMNGVAYDKIADALAAIPTSGDTNTYTIRLNKGTYKENGLSYNGTATVRIVGNTNTKYGADVIIMGRGNNMANMRGRELLEIQGSGNIILENLSLVSDVDRAVDENAAQAEVLGTDTKGNTVAYNCSFISHQDTLRTTGKAWFYGCYVEGDTDFIWMESSGIVALFENCEIVSVYDAAANSHTSYIAAPRMGITSKVGKGVVFLNSVVRESAEAKENDQKTYLARTPWDSGYYNQVAYINTICNDVEVTTNSNAPDAPWYGKMIGTDYPRTIIGWKMDSKSAASLNLTGKDYIVDDATVAKEFNGRNAILNRIYNTGKLKYEKDTLTNWDINSLISEYGYVVSKDTSTDVLEGESTVAPIVYTFDGSVDLSEICNGFAQDGAKKHFAGNAGSTITIPVDGKCYVEVYGYYSGTAEVKADTQGYSMAFFNNGSTNTEIQHDYIVYDAEASSVVITAKAKTYITKIVVYPDVNVPAVTLVDSIEITRSTPLETVGVPVTLTATVNKDATNKTVVWSSSDTNVADIDPYSGAVTFKAAGSVTFTATACDGSNVAESVECNPKESNWTVVEWYTTDKVLNAEEGATGIENFSVGGSSSKDIKINSVAHNYTFTDIAGNEVSTNKGLKLNGSGSLSVAVTKYALLTVIVGNTGNVDLAPVVSNGTVNATLISTTRSNDDATSTVPFTCTYVYEITDIGMWTIARQGGKETNPIIYAKCEYVERIISESIGVTFNGSNYTESRTNIANIITPSNAIDASKSTVEIEAFKLTGCKSNGSVTNWLDFKNNATIEFKIDKACTVLVGYYAKLQTVKLNGVEVSGNKTSVANGKGEIVEYEMTEAGTVVIEATQVDYLGFVGVLFKTLEHKKADAIEKLEEAYPADNYTQNENYETVLATQIAAINGAADEAALKVAYDAAVVAMDALEVDSVELPEFTGDYSYIFADEAGNYEAGAQINSTKYVEFVNCIEHNGFVALKNDNSVSIKVAADAKLVVNMPHSTGAITLNGEAYTLDENKNLTYFAAEDTTVVIVGEAGKTYISSIIIKTPYVFKETTTIDLSATGVKIEGTTGAYEGLEIDATSGKFSDNSGGYVQVNAGTIITLNVLEGAQVSLVAYSSVDNFEISEIVDGKITITCEVDDYLSSITVTYPVE